MSHVSSLSEALQSALPDEAVRRIKIRAAFNATLDRKMAKLWVPDFAAYGGLFADNYERRSRMAALNSAIRMATHLLQTADPNVIELELEAAGIKLTPAYFSRYSPKALLVPATAFLDSDSDYQARIAKRLADTIEFDPFEPPEITVAAGQDEHPGSIEDEVEVEIVVHVDGREIVYGTPSEVEEEIQLIEKSIERDHDWERLVA